MSGVGISGIIANLPGTVTPYPTQDPSLELGGYRTVADSTARDAIPANFRVLGMLVTLQSTGVTYQLFGGLANANWIVYTNAAFAGAYYVNSAFTGVQLGSQSNPFTTVAAAFAFAAVIGVTSGAVFLGQNHTENVVFPAAGNWELAGINSSGINTVLLTGTVDISFAVTPGRRQLTNLTVSGAVSGNAPNGINSRVKFVACYFLSTLTLTATGAGFWRAAFGGSVPIGANVSQSGVGGIVIGAVSVTGQVTSANWTYSSTFGIVLNFSTSDLNTFINCSFNGNITAAVGSTLRFIGTTFFFNGAQVIGSGGNIAVQFDGSSSQTFASAGPTVTNCVVSTLNANPSIRQLVNTNVGIGLSGLYPQALVRVIATMTLLVPGTLGNMILSVSYRDLLNVAQTKQVTLVPLNIAGVAGDEVSGEFTFSKIDNTGVSVVTSGITTAGALSVSVAAVARILN